MLNPARDETNGSGECEINTPQPGVSGALTIGETLHFTPAGSITTGGANLAIEITAGDFIMESGTFIDAGSGAACPHFGGAIRVTVDLGNVDLKTGPERIRVAM
jgi:hypothetical protein